MSEVDYCRSLHADLLTTSPVLLKCSLQVTPAWCVWSRTLSRLNVLAPLTLARPSTYTHHADSCLVAPTAAAASAWTPFGCLVTWLTFSHLWNLSPAIVPCGNLPWTTGLAAHLCSLPSELHLAQQFYLFRAALNAFRERGALFILWHLAPKLGMI